MKPRFRQSMNWLHTWAGFTFGWLLYFIFITGTVGYFENEIDRWMKPEKQVVHQEINTQQLLNTAETQLNALAAKSTDWYIAFPASRSPFVGISWLQLADKKTNTPRSWQEKNLNPETGDIINVRETAGGETLYRMHYNLHYVPQVVGYILTSLATMLMLVALVTGVIIHKKIFIEFFTFRPKKGLRSWLDIHNIFSVLPLPFHLMITYSGLILLMGITMSTVIDVNYGEGRVNHQKFRKAAHSEIKEQQLINLAPESLNLTTVLADAKTRHPSQKVSFIGLVKRGSAAEHYEIWFDNYHGIHLASSLEYHIKGDKVQLETSKGKAGNAAKLYDFFEHLHEGLFADIYLRWLYFIAGLLGAGMIATGMLLWIGKRNITNNSEHSFRIMSILERANIGVLVGLPIAVAAYFGANRLLPMAMNNRSEWEVHSLFITFIFCIAISLISSAKKAWFTLLSLAAISYSLLPVINLLTTNHSPLKSIISSDWQMLGVDLTLFLTGIVFTISAFIVNKKDMNR